MKTRIIPIENLYKAYMKEFSPIFKNMPKDLTEENLQARIRSNVLMALSNKFGYIVLCTGNKSEDAVGYSTLYGDTSGGYAPISDLLKKDVYALSKYRNKNKEIIPQFIIDRAPTAELRENQKDSDSLPEYDILDDILEKILNKNMSYGEIVNSGVSNKVLDKVWKLLKGAEYKRRQSPIGTKVSKYAFLREVSYPLVNKYIWKKTK
jgi:NAD+ synthetase